VTRQGWSAWALLGVGAAVTACGGWIDLERAGSGGGASSAGSSGDSGAGGTSDAHSGAFKILVLTTALEYRHDSITDCQRMLSELGQTPDDQLPPGAKPGSRFTTQVATDDLADFTAAGLKEYGLLFWCTPTGDVFSDNPRVESGATAMAALRDYVEGGGAWGGVHSATDFEKTGNFPWYTDTQPGFQVVARLAADNRPVVWIKELGANSTGRMFYTIRGHAPAVYREAEFRRLVLNGILWATRRLE
jgi:hypothetical protein